MLANLARVVRRVGFFSTAHRAGTLTGRWFFDLFSARVARDC